MMTTSGSTGLPKSLLIKHDSFFSEIFAYADYPYLLNGHQHCLQASRCSFDAHIDDIYGVLMFGSTIVMLRKGGLFDMEYFNGIMSNFLVSMVEIVPSLLQSIYSFLQSNKLIWKFVQTITLGGEALIANHYKLSKIMSTKCRFVNSYGPAECTITSFHFVLIENDSQLIFPVGKPLLNYKSYIFDSINLLVKKSRSWRTFDWRNRCYNRLLENEYENTRSS